MTTEQFITLVSDMRKAQKEYFRTRSKVVLEESKRLERMVDAELENIKNPSLF